MKSWPSPDVKKDKVMENESCGIDRRLLVQSAGAVAGLLAFSPRVAMAAAAPAPGKGWEWEPMRWVQICATEDDPGRCMAITARAGDQVVVPPGWAHCVIHAGRHNRMAFGAWCDRQYGFDYSGVRAHRGLAWFPTFGSHDAIEWTPNPHYLKRALEQRSPRAYPELGLDQHRSLYRQYLDDPESVMFVPEPGRAAKEWPSFTP